MHLRRTSSKKQAPPVPGAGKDGRTSSGVTRKPKSDDSNVAETQSPVHTCRLTKRRAPSVPNIPPFRDGKKRDDNKQCEIQQVTIYFQGILGVFMLNSLLGSTIWIFTFFCKEHSPLD